MEKTSTRARLFWRITAMLALLIVSPGPFALAETRTAGPKPITRENPEYPKGALRRGVEGSVLLEFTVDERGRVVTPRVLEGTPPGVFEEAALKALSSWRYEALGTETTNIKVKLTFRKG